MGVIGMYIIFHKSLLKFYSKMYPYLSNIIVYREI